MKREVSSSDIDALAAQVPGLCLVDRYRAQTKLKKIRHLLAESKHTACQRELASLHQLVDKSLRTLSRRRDAPLRIDYPDSLPISASRQALLHAIDRHSVVIVAGETGSGKTTQLPKLCMELGRGIHGRIGHTQPRRLAARTIATRLAEEVGTEVGDAVGYQFRFNDRFGDATRIKLMTDGILLAAIPGDRLLLEYDTLIIDEAHERSLNIDFLLGYIKTILPRRPDLKVIVTSATIDVDRFARHFDAAPVIEVSGRGYPVAIEYCESGGDDGDEALSLAAQVDSVIERIDAQAGATEAARHVLVFLPGEKDIRDVSRALKGKQQSLSRGQINRREILPLYARLSQREQQRIFSSVAAPGVRRIVLATNVAETSVTVPGIGYVIDSGTARISRYSARSKLQRLPIEAVSQASASQRAGRCGRIAPGICYRLYGEDDFKNRPAFTEPELLRTNLAAVILQMKALGLGDIAAFPFVEAPDGRQVRDGIKTLEELGAVDTRGAVTSIGKQLARLPVDPRLGRMLLAAQKYQCSDDALIIVSALAVQDPREFPADKQQAARELHRRFDDTRSDFVAWLNLWRYIEGLRAATSQSQLRRRLAKEYLSYVRYREWRDVHRQLKLAMVSTRLDGKRSSGAGSSVSREKGAAPADVDDLNYAALHTALLAGLLGNVGLKDKKHLYRGARNLQFGLHPGSSQFKRAPRWVMAAEVVETHAVNARCVAAIEASWIARAAGTRVKYQFSEPRWDRRRGQVRSLRSTSLYGLQLVARESVALDHYDPATARDIFLLQGLAAADIELQLPFWQHNLTIIARVQQREEKLRRRDVLVDEQQLAALYAVRLPEFINSQRSLEKWHRKASDGDRQRLFFSEEEVALQPDLDDTLQQFPDQMTVADRSFALHYYFAPGSERDGVTVVLPVADTLGLAHHAFDWLVPGLLRDKCIDMFKLLPKAERKQLVPIPSLVDAIMPRLLSDRYAAGDVPLSVAMAEQARVQRNVAIDTRAWQRRCDELLEDYYRMRFVIVDDAGESLGAGRSLSMLLKQCAQWVDETVELAADTGFRRTNIRRWDFERIPQAQRLETGDHRLHGFPALLDKGDSVTLDLLASETQAETATLDGVLRLLIIALPEKTRYLKKQLCRDERTLLPFVQHGTREDLVNDVIRTALEHSGLRGGALPADEPEFEACCARARAGVVAVANELEVFLYDAMKNYQTICERLQNRRGHFAMQCADIEAQLQRLLAPGFIRDAGVERLREYPRYLQAIGIRLERLSGGAARDAELCEKLASIEQPLWSLLYEYPQSLFSDPAVAHFRWLLEELRVSLFAQQLKTPIPVSFERAVKAWNLINHHQYLLVEP